MKWRGGRLERWIFLAALVAAGCAAPPLYQPTLSHLEIPLVREPGARIQALVSLRAVAADRERNLPAGMEARIRIDNDTEQRATLDPSSLELVARDLTNFPPPIVSPPSGLDLAPAQSGVVTARFAYPAGESAATGELSGVDLRWTVAVGGRPFSNGFTFHRVERPPSIYDPWFWEPEPHLVMRGEFAHHRR